MDSVRSSAGAVKEALGGSAVYFSIAASVFCRVGIVAVVGDDFPDEHRATLRARGVDITGLSVERGKTFRWSGVYSDDFNSRETLETQLNVFANFRPEIPREYRRAPFLFLGNIQPQLQLHVLDQMENLRIAAADTMNYWIDSDRDAVLDVLGSCDGVLLNDEEARSISREASLIKAAGFLLRRGPRFAVVKKGEHGCVLAHERELFQLPSYPVAEVRDPTGAGDSFAGGFLGYMAHEGAMTWETLKGAAAAGTAVASFGVEGFSVDGLLRASPAGLAERISTLARMCTFSPPHI